MSVRSPAISPPARLPAEAVPRVDYGAGLVWGDGEDPVEVGWVAGEGYRLGLVWGDGKDPVEVGWVAYGNGESAVHPTREGAVAAWRAKVKR